MRRNFSLTELLVAIAILMAMTSALASIYSNTSQIATRQTVNTDLFASAQRILDNINDDFNRAKLIPSTDDIVMRGGVQSTNPKTPWVGFVSSFPEVRFDPILSAAEGGPNATEHYNGWVTKDGMINAEGPIANVKFKAFHGVQEIAYYTLNDEQEEGTKTLHRAVRSPIGGPESITLENGIKLLKTDPRYKDKYLISRKVIYFDIRYLNDLNTNGLYESGNEEKTSLDSGVDGFPHAVMVSLSLAASAGAGQNEGTIKAWTNTSLTVVKSSGTFPLSGDFVGFILVGEGSSSKIFRFTSLSQSGDDLYTFTGAYTNGAPANPTGLSAMLGHTFTRTIPLRK